MISAARHLLATSALTLLLTTAVYALAGLVNSVLPAGGLGDILPGAIVYHSVGSCYTRAYAGTAVVIKDLATGATSSTLGCNGGSVVLTAGSNVSTTCASTCVVDTLYDQTTALRCASAACNLTRSGSNQPVGRFNNPFVGTFTPNGSLSAHFQGWAFGNGGTITGGSYNNSTGVLSLTISGGNNYVVGGAVRILTLTGSNTAPLLGGGVVIAPINSTTLTVQLASGLGAAVSITGGTYGPAAQTVNNTVGTFASQAEPYTVAWTGTLDGLQNAGTSGGPNACDAPNDCQPNTGFQTTTAPAITMTASSVSVASWPTTPTFDTWYSILAVFNGASSWLCVNGACNPASLATTTWAGLSYGNGSGGWGGKFGEAGVWPGDNHGSAGAFYISQKARFGVP